MSEKWLTFPAYCKAKYGRRLYRVSLDAGFTCPNRDGKIDDRGCIFCNEKGSGDFAIKYSGQKLSEEDLIFNKTKGEVGNYIAYFQSFTNTYGPISKLKRLFDRALSDDLFAGISIATRPDCLGKDVLNLLKELKEKYPHKFIYVELGLQTIHEASASFIRRGYKLAVFDQAVKALQKIDIEVIVHVIIGLPHEDEKMILATIRHLNTLHINGIKLQLLQYLKGTDLGDMYQRGEVKALSEDEYVDIIAKCLAVLNKDIVVHRLTGDGAKELLLAPLWANDKKHVLNHIRHEMKVRKLEQGIYEKSSDL